MTTWSGWTSCWRAFQLLVDRQPGARQREPELAAAAQPAFMPACPNLVRYQRARHFSFRDRYRRHNMIRSTYLSTLAIAALLGTAPAFAQTSSANANDAESKPTQSATSRADTAKNKGDRIGTSGTASSSSTTPLCSELN